MRECEEMEEGKFVDVSYYINLSNNILIMRYKKKARGEDEVESLR